MLHQLYPSILNDLLRTNPRRLWKQGRWFLLFTLALSIVYFSSAPYARAAADTDSIALASPNTLYARGLPRMNLYSRKCLDVAGGSLLDGAKIQQFTCHGGPNQEWVSLNTASSGYSALYNFHSHKCLDVAGGSLLDGAKVQQFTCHFGPNQRWYLRPDGLGNFELVNFNSGKCLDVEGGSVLDGAKVQQFTCHGGPNQRWR